MGRNVPSPTDQLDGCDPRRPGRRARRAAGAVRWSPAVGAADRLGAIPLGVDRLVAIGVGERAVWMYGRQRDLAGGLDAVQQVALPVGRQRDQRSPSSSVSPTATRSSSGRHRIAQHGARWQPATRSHQGLPAPVAEIGPLLEQQHLGRTAGLLDQVQPGRQHPGGVDDDQVARGRASRAGRGRGGARPRRRDRPAAAPSHAARSAPARCGPRAGRSRARPCPPPASVEPSRQASNRLGGSSAAAIAALGGAIRPRWAQAAGVTTRPRGVRISRPWVMRNGS